MPLTGKPVLVVMLDKSRSIKSIIGAYTDIISTLSNTTIDCLITFGDSKVYKNVHGLMVSHDRRLKFNHDGCPEEVIIDGTTDYLPAVDFLMQYINDHPNSNFKVSIKCSNFKLLNNFYF